MGLGISNCVKKVKDVVGGAVSKGVDTVGKLAGAAAKGIENKDVAKNSELPNALANATDSGINKISTSELKLALENAKTPEERAAILAELEKREAEKKTALAQQQPQQAQQSGGCSGGGCGGGNKAGGCSGANSVGQGGQVDKQTAMQNLYIAEKNLQAADENQSSTTNPFAANGSGSGKKEQAQQAYEQAKSVAQQAGVSDEEYASFKQQKQQEEEEQQQQV